MGAEKVHKILLSGDTLATCRTRVLEFMDKTTLLHYDTIEVVDTLSYSAQHPKFWPELEAAQTENRAVLRGFITTLEENRCTTLQDVRSLEDPYLCKLVHLVAHFVDGFIGIDSFFYNLCDDSHWLGEVTRARIEQSPEYYWLLHLHARFHELGTASLLHL